MNRYRDLNWRQEFGKRLQRTRLASGFSSQESFAKEVSVSITTACKYEMGERIPNAEIVAKMANALNCTADYLLLLEDSPNHDSIGSETVTTEKLISDTYATIEKTLESIRNDVGVPAGQIESLVALLLALVDCGCK